MSDPNEDDSDEVLREHEKKNRFPRPKYHPTIARRFDQLAPSQRLESSTLGAYRRGKQFDENVSRLGFSARPIISFPRRVYKYKYWDAPYVSYTVFMLTHPSVGGTLRPCIFYIHPGGPVVGNELFRIEQVLDWVVDLKLICVSVRYRLAPENLYPSAVEDCFSVMQDLTDNQALQNPHITAGIDLTKICILAGEGGAAIAAQLAIRLRDFRWGPGADNVGTTEHNVPKGYHVPSLSPSKEGKRDNESNDENAAPPKKSKQHQAAEQGTTKSPHAPRIVRNPFKIKGILLYSPMLDYRLTGDSTFQFKTGQYCDTLQSDMTWSLYFRGTYGNLSVSARDDRERYKEYNPGD